MSLNPMLALFLTPDRNALKFATRGMIAMGLALFVAMFLQLERPYWALISAAFLQIRPETGMVIEKGVYQIAGTLVGGAVGLAILAVFLPHPGFAVAALALWIGANATASALIRRMNLVYGLAITGVTAVLVVILTIVDPATLDSQTVFQVATARVSEIIVGAVCAMLAAMLLWPVQVKDMLIGQARDGINRSLAYMDLELSLEGTHAQRHAQTDDLLQTIIALADDSSAALFEGPEGPGRARAVSRLCQKLLSLLATIQIFGRFKRRHPELIGGEVNELLDLLRVRFHQMRATDSGPQAQRLAQTLRAELQQRPRNPDAATALQRRLIQMMREMIGDLIVALQGNAAIERSDRTLLKALTLMPYRDPLLAAITGIRSTAVFLVGAGVWFATGSPSAVVFMILPVIYSIMIGRLPSPPLAMRQILVGALIAVPVALFFALGLLAQAPPSFMFLIMIFGAPLFVALIAIGDLSTRSYGLGFALTYILIIRPGNQMSFAMDQSASFALAIVAAISVVYVVFRLITTPGARLMRRRLVASTVADLRRLGTTGAPDTADWFNARMAERLMRLSAYDRALPRDRRYLTDLALTGLNLGHTSLRLQRLLKGDNSPRVRAAARRWQRALAEAYELCSQGRRTRAFARASERLVDVLAKSGQIDADRRLRIEGTTQRLALTFERIADTVADATDANPQSASDGAPTADIQRAS